MGAYHMDGQRVDELLMLLMALLLAIVTYCMAGAADYSDRTEGLGANMLPSENWTEAVRRG